MTEKKNTQDFKYIYLESDKHGLKLTPRETSSDASSHRGSISSSLNGLIAQ